MSVVQNHTDRLLNICRTVPPLTSDGLGLTAMAIVDHKPEKMFKRYASRLNSINTCPTERVIGHPLEYMTAEVAELADALDSGSSALTGVRVQIPASAPIHFHQFNQRLMAFLSAHS